jgi:predicted CoA-binding protein
MPVTPNPADAAIREALKRARTIAVVGLSDGPNRPSHAVAEYLQRAGYKVLPVNPQLAGRRLLGETTVASLRGVPDRVDIVDVFRRPEAVPGVVEDALAIAAPLIWFQLGVIHEEAAARARRAGRLVVQDRCLKIEHARLLG